MIGNAITIEHDTCMACGLCAEVCPNKIPKKAPSVAMLVRQDRLCFLCGQCMAICPTESIVVDGLSYARDFVEISALPALAHPFFDLIATRRAIRNFQDKAVPQDLLEQIVRAIAFAPPGFPPLKTEIVVVQDPALMRQALPHLIEVYDSLVAAMSNPMARLVVRSNVGRQTFNTVRRHVVPLMKSRLPELKSGAEDTLTRGAPAMILFHAHRDAENYQADLYIALTYGFLAAHALGLGACPIDLIPPAIERNGTLRGMFLIPAENRVVASMVLGYPKFRYRRIIKRELKGVQWL